MAVNLEEYWVMHRPRHPIWGTVMFSATALTKQSAPLPNINFQLYTGDEKDYLFYKYTPSSGYPLNYAVSENPWLVYTVAHSIKEAIAAAKRIIPWVGQDNIRIVKVVPNNMSINS